MNFEERMRRAHNFIDFGGDLGAGSRAAVDQISGEERGLCKS